MRKELFSPFRFYDSIEKKYSRRKARFEASRPFQDSGADYLLVAPKTSFLPFVYLRNPSSSIITSIKVVSNNDQSTAFEITSGIPGYVSVMAVLDDSNSTTDNLIYYTGSTISGMTLDEGSYYLEITDSAANKMFSEDFYATEVCEYIRLRWWSNTDFDYYPFSQGYINTMYVDSELIYPSYEGSEEGSENGKKQFNPSFQKSEKYYKLKFDFVPEYISDALSLLFMSDNFTLSKDYLNIHVENHNGDMIDFQVIEETPLSQNLEVKFIVDSVYKGASSENLSLTSI